MTGEAPGISSLLLRTGTSAEAAAEYLGVAPERLSEWKAGVARPSYRERKQLIEFAEARAYQRAVDALHLPECAEERRLIDRLAHSPAVAMRTLEELDRHERNCAICRENLRVREEKLGKQPLADLSVLGSLLEGDGWRGALFRFAHRPKALPLTLGAMGLGIWGMIAAPDVARLTFIPVAVAGLLTALSIRSFWKGPAD